MSITVVAQFSDDPELRYSEGGSPICSFRIGERRQEGRGQDALVEWTNYNCEARGDLAENIGASAAKGDRFLFTGEMRIRTWENQEGKKRESLYFLVTDAGPALRFATCEVTKNPKKQS
jgi:single-strand DNA-binding protein